MGDKAFRHIVQVGIVVKDIEQARASWSKLLGVEEPQIMETEGYEETHMTFRGKPSNGRAKLTFFNLENLTLELIEPIGGPSTWQDFKDKYDGGIHHVAFIIENLAETLETLDKAGISVEQRGDYGKEATGCYIYTDSKQKLGAIIELLHTYPKKSHKKTVIKTT